MRPHTSLTITGDLRIHGWVLQLVAIGAGIGIGVEVFEWATSSTVTIGFG